jgi:hypothetical protein
LGQSGDKCNIFVGSAEISGHPTFHQVSCLSSSIETYATSIGWT